MSLNWSEWHDISDGKSAPDKPGVYRVRLTQNGEPVAIHRFLGTDPEGILWIGKTISLQERLRRAGDVLQGKSGSHSEASLLHALEQITSLNSKYPQRIYQYCWAYSEDVDQQEEDLIWDYVRQYGEAPPLNRAIPGGQKEAKRRARG